MAQLALPHPVLTRCGARALVATLLCGCALWHAPPREVLVHDALPEGTTIPPTFAGPAAAGEVANDWLASFDDPGMRAVVKEAIAYNLDLRAAAASVEIARETVTVVGAALLPQVGAVVGGTRTRDDEHGHAFNSQVEYVGITWEIDLWGQLRAERAAAQAQYEATALAYAFARQSLAATTAKSWYLAIETRLLLDLAQQDLEVYRRLSDLVGQRYAAGKVGRLDVAEAAASVSQAEASVRAAQAADLEARRSLELLVGRYPDAEIRVAPSFPPVPAPVPPGLPASLLERRPDLVAAEQRVLAAFRTREATELSLFPSFSLSLEGGHFDLGVLSILRLNPWLLHGGLGMNVPIYEGGALVAQVRISTAEQSQAVALYGNAMLEAFREAEAALANEWLLDEQIRFAEDSMTERTEAVRMVTLKYQAGSTDLLSVLQIQTALIATQADVIQLRNAQLANRINLHLAVGGSFDAANAAALPATP